MFTNQKKKWVCNKRKKIVLFCAQNFRFKTWKRRLTLASTSVVHYLTSVVHEEDTGSNTSFIFSHIFPSKWRKIIILSQSILKDFTHRRFKKLQRYIIFSSLIIHIYFTRSYTYDVCLYKVEKKGKNT